MDRLSTFTRATWESGREGFDAIYRRCAKREIFHNGHGRVVVLPSGEVQIDLDDPNGNTVDINARDWSKLRPLAGPYSFVRRRDQLSEGEDKLRARLFMDALRA